MPPIHVTEVFYKRDRVRKEADIVRYMVLIHSITPEKKCYLSLMSKLYHTLKKIAMFSEDLV